MRIMPYLSDFSWHLLLCVAGSYRGSIFHYLYDYPEKPEREGRKIKQDKENGW